MAKIYNSRLTNELSKAVALQNSTDVTPSEIADKVIPTVETNPKLLGEVSVTFSNNLATTGSGTIISALQGKKFVITGIDYNIVKDATCDTSTASATMIGTIQGVSRTIVTVPCISVTAQQFAAFLDFSTCPIIVDENTAVQWASKTFTVGVFLRCCTIYGYYIDNVRA